MTSNLTKTTNIAGIYLLNDYNLVTCLKILLADFVIKRR